ncbi:hypothetical protein VMCG_08925 [Cytospora schulzeri]|uniref:Uncharacterized protein n=1 Tax=Cytospora schulzeri TaxID=448051 RepID=A0A423VNJ7_9PEZI|nr:hypothetical protein VMCG_08925 [Valsa malicola]
MASDTLSGQASRVYSDITSGTCSPDDLDSPMDMSVDHAYGRVQVPIAVLGMGCRLPGHNSSPTTLWDFLQNGGVASNDPPPSRFNLGGHYDKSGRPRTMKSPGGMFAEDVDPAVFDGQFFNISRADCIAMEPQQRQLLEVSYECLENAGIPLEKVSGTKTGVIVGTNFNDYAAIQNRDPEDRADSITIGLASSILSNRMSHFLDVHGPSMTIDTACSASLVAVDVACRYLDSFQADAMLVGGTNMWLSPEHNEEIGMMNMTQSASGKCHSFSANADGYVKAEGFNVVYLKRLDDALRDGDPIRAVIRGTAASASGRTAGIANPSPDAQALTIRAAYQNAGITDFKATSFLECHGTGTLAGDPVEVKGAAQVFAADREEGQELIIGSVKSNIGHSEAAAGLSGLIKAILAVERGVIPGTPLFVSPNPNIDWSGCRVKASRTSLQWPKMPAGSLRRASVNSFGFGGANAHAVLEQAQFSRHVSSYNTQVSDDFFDSDDDDYMDGVSQDTPSETLPTVLVFSANDQTSLKGYVKALSAHLINPAVSVKLEDLAYTLSERRSRHYYRAFSIVHTKKSSRVTIDDKTLVTGKQSSLPPRIGFVFTGQGAQWSQMGLDLIKTEPLAEKVIKGLDEVLQTLPEPPSWSLLEELTQARSADRLRQPEFSQPLVTALQLALVEVLRYWRIKPVAVVGHSSGEIAAAAAAGLITFPDAIKAAYYRGQAAKQVGAPANPVGMLAVGVGSDAVEGYLQTAGGKVQIACYNSPNSLTLSGPISALEKLRDELQHDGHFARLLQVDLAYHSQYMKEIGETYESLLLSDSTFHKSENKSTPAARMFSSVTGSSMPDHYNLDELYWKSNMVSPVLFMQAASEMLRDPKNGADFLIEIGPSNALSGPIAQIKKSLVGISKTEAPYTATLQRGAGSTTALYNMAGQLYLAGGSLDLARVNRVSQTRGSMAPSVIVDLPNYSWNHSTRYWHETQASKDWRFKKFIIHDILGSKVNGITWQAPVFKKVLKLDDVPWLRDHKLGNQVVFPAAAYIAQAVEAIYQTAMVTQWKEVEPARYRYRLRDIKLHRALVLEENTETRITLSLNPVQGGSTRTWYEFTIRSVQDENQQEHSTGFVCVESDYQDETAPAGSLGPLKLATPGRVWYKALADAGYNFGPCFQKHLQTEMDMGKRTSRSTVNLEPPPSGSHSQSSYPIHPAVMDACLQTGSPPLWRGDPSEANAVLVPRIIDSLVIAGRPSMPVEGITLSSATFLGVGNTEKARNYATNVDLYDPKDGTLLFEMKGLASAEIETSEDDGPGHAFSRPIWAADIDLLMTGGTTSIHKAPEKMHMNAQEVIDLMIHKKPALKVLEVNMGSNDTSSLWLQHEGQPTSNPRATAHYYLALSEPKSLVDAQRQHSDQGTGIQFLLLDAAKPGVVAPGIKFDLVIVKKPSTPIQIDGGEEVLLKNLALSLRDKGFIMAAGFAETSFSHLGKAIPLTLPGDHIYLCQFHASGNDEASREGQRPTICQVSLTDVMSQASKDVAELLDAVNESGWTVKKCVDPIQDIQSNEQVVVVLDEVFTPVMNRLNEEQWKILKHFIQLRCRLLWVTSGGHLNVTNPDHAAAAGFLRTIRSEEQLRVMTLDIEDSRGKASLDAIASCLDRICAAEPNSSAESEKVPLDFEYVERGGVVHINRLVPDAELNALQSDDSSSHKTDVLDLRECETMVQLQCERLGNLDALHFVEATPEPTSLKDGWLEVEIHAAGLNYKDVVVAMGLVPGDETAMGHEAAGIITKVTPGVAESGSDLQVGQRVVVFGKGCFANRLETTPARVHRIPDSMTFEQAATLSVVYLTALHSLFDLASLTAGKRVLIHSAAGGVGIAAIQLAKYAGAEVSSPLERLFGYTDRLTSQIFATVGTEEKREFLKSNFGLSDARIFHSRNTDFAKQILSVTQGYGVDVVLNSLTGDMLDESFRILADGGIMVEIGKRDILDRNKLPMAPFDRNISFRAVDLSPERAPDALVSRLMTTLFELVEGQHITPIDPMHRYSWTDIPSAIRFLRAGKHIGKVVLSDQPGQKIEVPVRRASKKLHTHDARSYLIVGGLRGLCGSLCIYLAKNGVKNLAVLSRSGHTDEKSQAVIKQVKALGAHIDLLIGDVTIRDDVERAFSSTRFSVAGIIQGAMVLRDRPFDSMTLSEYHEAVQCKIQGTWNLHNVAEGLGVQLDFFTMLSSISGVIGNRGQANYAAANVFMDSFADFRRQRGQAACSIDLGVIEDAGVIAENTDFQAQHFDSRSFKGINDRSLRRILYLSILQQQGYLRGPQTQIVTGLVDPQPPGSALEQDARFLPYFTKKGRTDLGGTNTATSGGNAEVETLLLMLKTSTSEPAARLAATTDVVNKALMRILRLSEPMDPGRPFSVFGVDSLSAVEVRNWVRGELGAMVTTLDILNASSLTAFCQKIMDKIGASSKE